MRKLTESQFQELETQLSCPNGENGLAIGNLMHENNCDVTNNAIAALQLEANQQTLEIGHGLGVLI